MKLASIVVGLFLSATTTKVTPSIATELKLPKVTSESMGGEWEGAWRDRVVGRLIVVHLRVDAQKRAVLTLVSGPSNPFVEPFTVSRLDCVDGVVTLEGSGTDDATGASIRLNGPGWAGPQDGILDASLRKITRSARTIAIEVRLIKMEGGFFRHAQQLKEAAATQRTRSPKK